MIETPRLMLRGWNSEDAEAWYQLMQEDGILRYFPDPTPPPRSRADEYIAYHLAQWEQHRCGHWAVVTRNDGRVVGWSGLNICRSCRRRRWGTC